MMEKWVQILNMRKGNLKMEEEIRKEEETNNLKAWVDQGGGYQMITIDNNEQTTIY